MKRPTNPLKVMLWTARIASALIVASILVFVVGYALDPNEPAPTASEALRLLFFPLGMCVGYVIGWRWQLMGGVISLGCLTTFLFIMGEADLFGIIYLLGLPGVLFLLYGLMRRRERDVSTAR